MTPHSTTCYAGEDMAMTHTEESEDFEIPAQNSPSGAEASLSLVLPQLNTAKY